MQRAWQGKVAIMDVQALVENPALPAELRQKVLDGHVRSEEKDALLKVYQLANQECESDHGNYEMENQFTVPQCSTWRS